jgi:hypothetical protein
VTVSLAGVPGRAGQWFFVGLSIAAAVACAAYGFWDPRFFAGVAFLFSALMYWLTIRWGTVTGRGPTAPNKVLHLTGAAGRLSVTHSPPRPAGR